MRCSDSGTAKKKKQTPWSESASELYRPSDSGTARGMKIVKQATKLCNRLQIWDDNDVLSFMRTLDTIGMYT
jgi:hypothetical protein